MSEQKGKLLTRNKVFKLGSRFMSALCDNLPSSCDPAIDPANCQIIFLILLILIGCIMLRLRPLLNTRASHPKDNRHLNLLRAVVSEVVAWYEYFPIEKLDYKGLVRDCPARGVLGSCCTIYTQNSIDLDSKLESESDWDHLHYHDAIRHHFRKLARVIHQEVRDDFVGDSLLDALAEKFGDDRVHAAIARLIVRYRSEGVQEPISKFVLSDLLKSAFCSVVSFISHRVYAAYLIARHRGECVQKAISRFVLSDLLKSAFCLVVSFIYHEVGAPAVFLTSFFLVFSFLVQCNYWLNPSTWSVLCFLCNPVDIAVLLISFTLVCCLIIWCTYCLKKKGIIGTVGYPVEVEWHLNLLRALVKEVIVHWYEHFPTEYVLSKWRHWGRGGHAPPHYDHAIHRHFRKLEGKVPHDCYSSLYLLDELARTFGADRVHAAIDRLIARRSVPVLERSSQ
jgi:hypothetical protein